jgi:hypothetical protein
MTHFEVGRPRIKAELSEIKVPKSSGTYCGGVSILHYILEVPTSALGNWIFPTLTQLSTSYNEHLAIPLHHHRTYIDNLSLMHTTYMVRVSLHSPRTYNCSTEGGP